MTRNISIAMLVAILSIINFSIFSKEQHLKNAKTVYLELAPVDPRSLMQGDYMALRFTVADKLYEALPKTLTEYSWKNNIAPHDGKVIVRLNAQQVASYRAVYQGQTLNDNEITLNYRVRDNKVMLASNAFFFEEGTAKTYEIARYGEFKVNTKGELLLKAMFDEQLVHLTPDL